MTSRQARAKQPTRPFATGLDMARSACQRRADEPLIRYFDAVLSGGDVDRASDALAVALAERGVRRGDRVALYLQNVPQFPIAVVAAWKLGAIVVPVNPMLRESELNKILLDSGASVLISADDLYESVARRVLPLPLVETVITASAFDYLDDVPTLLGEQSRLSADDVLDFGTLIAERTGSTPAAIELTPDDIALLVYTSGTTGPSKGATNLHGNVAFASHTWAEWVGLDESDVNLVMAPIFHITGLIAGLGASLAGGTPFLLSYRFDPATVLDLVRRYRPTFTVAAITAYTALRQASDFAATDFSCLRAAYTGGASVPSAVAQAWRLASGVRLHNAYGLTETTSPLTLTPLGVDGPVDAATGVLSVGVAVYESTVEILADDGSVAPTGDVGEIVASGPQVVPGYWQRPEETANALPDGRLRTGDVGYIDGDGWVYLVDRRKDLINAAGYKVWPREVEDVLYEHPAVREAAVIGVPDEYRGETVHAFVSLRADGDATPEDLIAFCKARMAAYKYPRVVQIIDELPKNTAGKILRRSLREVATGGGDGQ